MPNPHLPPGAFFSAGWHPTPTGGHSAGWHPMPTGGQHAGWHPTPTGGQQAGWHPWPTGGHDAGWHPTPTGAPQAATGPGGGHARGAAAPVLSYPVHPATASPWPWQNFDPAWTYADGNAPLLAQALRKTRARIVMPRDPRRPQPPAGQVGKPSSAASALWRWQSPFRAKTVVAELMSRYHVEGTALWRIDRVVDAGGSPKLSDHRLLSIQAPDPDRFNYDEQIDRVVRAAVEREERLPEILSQADDFRPFFAAVTGLDRLDVPHTGELFDIAWDWATHVVMALKHNIAELRPVQRSALVMPVIPTPGHGAMPSGHATLAALTSELLSALLYRGVGPRVAMLDRLARRITFNRVVAGVHFDMDGFVGYELGRCLAQVLVRQAMGSPAAPPPPEHVVAVNESSGLREQTYKHVPLGLPARGNSTHSLWEQIWQAAEQELELQRV